MFVIIDPFTSFSDLTLPVDRKNIEFFLVTLFTLISLCLKSFNILVGKLSHRFFTKYIFMIILMVICRSFIFFLFKPRHRGLNGVLFKFNRVYKCTFIYFCILSIFFRDFWRKIFLTPYPFDKDLYSIVSLRYCLY